MHLFIYFTVEKIEGGKKVGMRWSAPVSPLQARPGKLLCNYEQVCAKCIFLNVWQRRRKSVSVYMRRAFVGDVYSVSVKCSRSGNFHFVFCAAVHKPCCCDDGNMKEKIPSEKKYHIKKILQDNYIVKWYVQHIRGLNKKKKTWHWVTIDTYRKEEVMPHCPIVLLWPTKEIQWMFCFWYKHQNMSWFSNKWRTTSLFSWSQQNLAHWALTINQIHVVSLKNMVDFTIRFF